MERVFEMRASDILTLLIAKVQRKGQRSEEVFKVINWLLGYDAVTLEKVMGSDVTYKAFFDQAPKVNDDYLKVTGSICKVRIETIEDRTYRMMRVLDKLVDELAKGKKSDDIIAKYTGDR